MKVCRFAVSSGVLGMLMLASSAWAGFPTLVKSSGGGEHLSVGDVNGDGRDDLIAFTPANNPAIEAFESWGDGSFRASASLAGVQGRLCLWSYAPHLEDVDGDGRLDFAAFSYRRTSKIFPVQTWPGTYVDGADFTLYENVWLGRGDGTFVPLRVVARADFKARPLPSEDFAQPGVYEDFDRDGINGLAVLSRDRRGYYVSPVLIFLEIPTTKDDPPVPDLSVEIGRGTFSTLASGDFDGDGWVDLVASNPKTLTSLLNDTRW